MAYVEKRGPRKYRGRYRDPNGNERSRTFPTRRDADRFLADTVHSVNRGQYVDPAHGRRTFGEYANEWLAMQVFRDQTRERVESNVRVHMLPTFKGSPVGEYPPERNADVGARSQRDPRRRTRCGLSTGNSLQSFTPRERRPDCKDPVPRREAAEGLTLASSAVADRSGAGARQSHAEYLQALMLTIAGSGLRQGEALGLTVDRIDFLRRTIRVDRQLVTLQGQDPQLAPPKTEASMRTIPVPQLVIDALADHLARFPSTDLVFKNSKGGPWRRRCSCWRSRRL